MITLSFEVVYSSGGAEKLARYQVLGVPEVWFWEDGTLNLYHLGSNGNSKCDRSQLPGLINLDIELLKRCILIGETSLAEAVKLLRQGIGIN